ncbi:thioredoxin [Candidatus Poribacteria bacterium]|nr:thioredoxin [Candidatus Poribacteria bacterium]
MASDTILQVTDGDFEEKVLRSALPVVVDFWAEWCGPCRMVAPTLEEVAKECQDKAVIAKLNVDDNRATATQYKIHAIPTMIFFKAGKETARLVGVETKKTIMEKIDGML